MGTGEGAVHKAILKALQDNPGGLDIHQIAELVGRYGRMPQFNRRLRELDSLYRIDRDWDHGRCIYRYVGPRPAGERDARQVSKKDRARVLLRDGGRCQLCGRSAAEDGVRLHIDHKIPRDWGGLTEPDNLWALCSECNEGKKNYYSGFDSSEMVRVMRLDSVHARLAELLHLREGQWVDCDVIETVANSLNMQTDWRKRLRELRYLGLKIVPRRKKIGRRNISQYKLTNWVELPPDPTKAARQYERDRAQRNRRSREAEGGSL